MKKKNGGDSTSVSSTKRELVGMKKGNATEYNKPKIHNTTKFTTRPKNATVMVTKAQAKKK